MAAWENYMTAKKEFEKVLCKDTGKEIKLEQDSESVWITPTVLRLPSGKMVTTDPNEVSFEVYNPNKFPVVFENLHPFRCEWRGIRVSPGQHKLIPHRYVRPWIDFVGNTRSNGEKIKMLENHGDKMFRGNKFQSKLTSLKD